ncbi:hypothetical protein GRI97_05940 [Altererythrobacter xixiisoli]|uniref:Lipoprotein n=1 Tax=Croceibacterium xixiisoli TaxID=1476466 RepID=A0A6I4TUV1_9SPHN|nr:hypothetical protein [Croceibacterium xixiisoli]MXO98527.1 hypothetical protein [Croceibacterium xixiisoli]
MSANRLRGAHLFTAGLLLAGCGEQQLSYSSAPGFIDLKPDNLWGPQYPYSPPESDGRPFDPTGGIGVQKFADQLIGKRIATFVGHGWDSLRSGVNVNDFFTPPEPGPGTGICMARRFQIGSTSEGGGEVKAADGEWRDNVYAIAGSVAPVPGPPSSDYKSRLLQACRKRSDMDMWYSAKSGQAYLAARLADAVIATARQPLGLPFELRCTPYPSSEREKPLCQADVRKSVASINPRAIIEVGDCFDAKFPNCLSIQFPKMPERSTQIEDRWTLNVHFKDNGIIESVAVEDTRLIID